MGEFEKWLLKNLENEEIIQIVRENKVKIKGFDRIQEINNKLNAPKTIIINEIIKLNNKKNFLEDFFKKDKNQEKFRMYDNEKFLKDYYEPNELIAILKYLYNRQEKEKTLNLLIDRIDLSKNIKMQQFVRSEEKDENENREKEMIVLKQMELEKENKKLKDEIKGYKRRQIELENKNQGLQINLSNKERVEEKEKINYQKLKKKYDEIKNKEKDFLQRDEEITRLKEINKIIRNELNEYREKKNEKKIIFIGEKKEWLFETIKNEKMEFIEMNNFMKRNLSDRNIAIWFIANETTLINQKKILNIKNIEIKKFDTISELKSYVKGELVNV